MSGTETLSVSLPLPLLQEAQRLARKENRSLDELVLEALRRYQEDQRWEELRALGRSTAEAAGVRDEQDVVDLIHEFRREERTRLGEQSE
jgi:metal-responsive CopG/Arc/MetJ family transcriptional regulator